MSTVNDLLDLSLRELMEEYVVVENLECGYYYGIVPIDLIERIYDEYDIEKEYPEAFYVQNMIKDEILTDFGEEVIDYDKLKEIMNNLGINKKKVK